MSRFVRFLVCGVALCALSRARAADAPGWMQPLTLGAEARDGEHLQTALVRQGTLHDTVSALARVSADLSRTVVIRTSGDGKVTAVRVTPGQTVVPGQALIDYTDHSLHVLHLQLEQDEAALASAKATLGEAELSYRRGQSLVGSTVSAGEVRRRQAAVQQARSTVVAREADIGLIQHRLTEEFTSVTEKIVQDEASTLISPVRGVVQSIQTSVASDVTPGQPVATVVDLSGVWIVADLRPDEVSRLVPGGVVTVRPSGNARAEPFRAKITTIDGVADPVTGLVRVVCVVDRPVAFLRPGIMLDAALETSEAVDGMIVPSNAVQTIEGHDLVYVQTAEGQYAPREVRVRLATDESVVVQGNLKAGDAVVTEGSFALKSMSLVSGLDTD
ncbi:efflux RND transporter periplasmic adaptor subunit [Gluconobacter oxydans]|uniref:Cation efflux protein n=2 Tax=Gluconobacter oxydans TaxID=442 RepID=Q5FTG3_GLUOX|nr:efflux RND transporter periplasmic adaptor subunit [Gluconobacter oxydans]AAW60333.1 Cation efflux protein [Gluconobacter oxydans 621H]MBF0855279.1 efflux RND transporter periplasmic adaptor subunit [Gluconobacter oxydans]MCP1247639.1 efflux RND transporter periplasmic adaptor subunit [Gluconobacter oxydans]TCW28793.1 cobalt-zinc-cadmium efflux system membrane fusion protein [Gluconobacter oxydans]GEC59774.1 cation efflux system protein [Gluconobacter oxydans]